MKLRQVAYLRILQMAAVRKEELARRQAERRGAGARGGAAAAAPAHARPPPPPPAAPGEVRLGALDEPDASPPSVHGSDLSDVGGSAAEIRALA
eukprot:11345676-Alexandrium_andersonii.AAC.1